MKVRLTTIPFHCLFPNAPVHFANYVVTIPVYDPEAHDRTEAVIKAAMRLGVNAAVACEPRAKWKPRGLPKFVYLPVATTNIVRYQNGSGGMKLVSLTCTPLGFSRFKLKDLATKPFRMVKSTAIPKGHSKLLRLKVEG